MLSRLPGELGKYLALTGNPLNALDAKEVGLISNLIHDVQLMVDGFTDALRVSEDPPSWRFRTWHGYDHPHDKSIDDKRARLQDIKDKDELELQRKLANGVNHFVEPWNERPNRLARSDMGYLKMIRDKE